MRTQVLEPLLSFTVPRPKTEHCGLVVPAIETRHYDIKLSRFEREGEYPKQATKGSARLVDADHFPRSSHLLFNLPLRCLPPVFQLQGLESTSACVRGTAVYIHSYKAHPRTSRQTRGPPRASGQIRTAPIVYFRPFVSITHIEASSRYGHDRKNILIDSTASIDSSLQPARLPTHRAHHPPRTPRCHPLSPAAPPSLSAPSSVLLVPPKTVVSLVPTPRVRCAA
jgi:hypothetical protein